VTGYYEPGNRGWTNVMPVRDCINITQVGSVNVVTVRGGDDYPTETNDAAPGPIAPREGFWDAAPGGGVTGEKVIGA
jgi:hypothetical protein